MKKLKVSNIILLLLTAVVLVFAAFVPMRDENKYIIFEPYQYPIVPGTPEWKALRSNIDKINVCRVPDEIVVQMSTDAHLETFLAHPLAGNMFAFDSYHVGFNVIRDYHYTGLGELMKRDDSGEELFKEYNKGQKDMLETALIEVLAAEMDDNSTNIPLVAAISSKTNERAKNKSAYGAFAETYFRVMTEKYNT